MSNLPNFAFIFLRGIHVWADRAAPVTGEGGHVGECSLHSELVRGVGPGQHGQLQRLGPRLEQIGIKLCFGPKSEFSVHLWAPDIRSAQPEHLSLRVVEARQQQLLAVGLHPFIWSKLSENMNNEILSSYCMPCMPPWFRHYRQYFHPGHKNW